MSARLKVGFTGYYGMRNFGDDLFGVLCAAAARRYWDGEPLLVGPRLAESGCRSTMPRWYPASLYGATGAGGKASRLYSFLRAVAGTDVLVMGGGSVITARESFRKPLMLAARRYRGLQLAAVGVSIGPFANAAEEAHAAEFVSQFRYLAVRDARSYEAAQRMGVGEIAHRGRDLAGLLPLLAPAPRPPQVAGRRLRIGLAPCNYGAKDGYPVPERVATHAALVQALKQLAARFPLQVDVFSLNEHPTHGDVALGDALQRALGESGVLSRRVRYRGMGPLALAREIAACDAFVSARLHGAIVSYLYGVPFTIIDYHPKCRDFADDIGLGPLQRITAQRHDAAAFGEAFAAMLAGDGRPALSREIYAGQAQDIFKCAPWAQCESLQPAPI
ncbi:polysaccharide pyruvyl transferase family protein [Vulcaniibacterium tengchongense]|uniref:Polysaccharide pyruvyl transferase WcaK-like protein n=1 Tax=Vulcaniibacterium tengchongense TaxID=1273429 RepID=A0A3N4VX26_9GAMM|nr:polysaccharide pyruvyl transferase family protein [Vulcaniibacterium tengchongense]RPE81657.1 polysaccharide pyruvyl transferase WcaK-like protein [Vulcaniibacterium tengchongense]